MSCGLKLLGIDLYVDGKPVHAYTETRKASNAAMKMARQIKKDVTAKAYFDRNGEIIRREVVYRPNGKVVKLWKPDDLDDFREADEG